MYKFYKFSQKNLQYFSLIGRLLKVLKNQRLIKSNSTKPLLGRRVSHSIVLYQSKQKQKLNKRSWNKTLQNLNLNRSCPKWAWHEMALGSTAANCTVLMNRMCLFLVQVEHSARGSFSEWSSFPHKRCCSRSIYVEH